MFANICITAEGIDLYRLSRPAAHKAWMYRHLTLALAAYVAAVTAFSTVNLNVMPLVARWTWPTSSARSSSPGRTSALVSRMIWQ